MELHFGCVEQGEDMVLGPFGIWEPIQSAPPVAIDEIDLIVVPGVAFDRSGGRIGQGGGFYDRLLQHYQGVSVGLAFSCQMYDQLPMNEWDRSVDIVLRGNG